MSSSLIFNARAIENVGKRFIRLTGDLCLLKFETRIRISLIDLRSIFEKQRI